ncbi:hypothetical protein B0A48_09203 [Cryoendolithus antarcticus]|uniref:Uncharacterized protein n=1 Tax=Cryoendolithus antarcticus TaxID=1507870 RepID=A0A1V8T2B2_9PEZI|nr:hypothetical protein B0A48_09203 [Cryoendolithus antarcticus]
MSPKKRKHQRKPGTEHRRSAAATARRARVADLRIGARKEERIAYGVTKQSAAQRARCSRGAQGNSEQTWRLGGGFENSDGE